MNLERLQSAAAKLNCIFKENEILAPYTRLGIGGKCPFYIKPSNWEATADLIRLLSEDKIDHKVLGKGTNVLISDKNLSFGVLHILGFDQKIAFNEEKVEVSADTLLSSVAEKSFENNLSGLEEICLIPGTVGGCAYMNAGAFGKTIFDFIERISILDCQGKENSFSSNEIKVEYRKTNIRDLGIVKSVAMQLKKDQKSNIDQKVEEFRKKRDLTQPWKERTCGSVFKNPKDISAGRLLEEIGFKGKTKGGVRFSEKHANFLISEGGATFDDAIALLEEARETALKKGLHLEYEMEVWQNGAN
ncbi:MAG: UDP-N-acetylmuramate dehydrogenase [Acidobacteria bacterium]|nr:UDP-N-acetylmuramate dehydrogenase [Acidobacteriota bacterium]